MTFNIKDVNGQKVVTDENGTVQSWVHTVDFVLLPGGTQMLYLGTTDFGASINVGAAPTAPAPVTPPAPAAAHS